jgi:hypothetical protein
VRGGNGIEKGQEKQKLERKSYTERRHTLPLRVKKNGIRYGRRKRNRKGDRRKAETRKLKLYKSER